MKRKFTLLLLFVASCGFVFAQQVGSLPSNPEPGKCYVRCITPDIFETIEERIMVSPAYKVLSVVPAEYRWDEERVLIKPATKRFTYVPAVFETYYDETKAEDPYNRITLVDPTFVNDVVRIMIEPEVSRWEYSTLEACESDDPNDCRVLCYKAYPAIYDNFNIQKLSRDASYNKSPVAGSSQKVKKQRIVKEAHVTETVIPAKYTTIRKKILVKDETVTEKTIQAEYQNISKEVLKEKGGLTVWKEIDCQLTDFNVIPIYYELGSARLTAESKRTINNTLLKILKDNPMVKIELNSHTDSRDDAARNMDLSQRRAQSVVSYLGAKGIKSNRLIAKGYGETRLLNRCSDGVQCSEAEHQKNRRTEFRVINQ